MVIVHDTLTGILELHGRPVVIAAMNYRRAHLLEDQRRFGALSSADTVRQLRPVRVVATGDGIDTLPAQRLIAQPWSDIHVQCAWMGSASLDLLWPAAAPLAALPVHRVHGGLHCVVDFRREPLRRLFGRPAAAYTAEATSRIPQLVTEGGMQ
jgi:acetoacetate decarboxylase